MRGIRSEADCRLDNSPRVSMMGAAWFTTGDVSRLTCRPLTDRVESIHSAVRGHRAAPARRRNPG